MKVSEKKAEITVNIVEYICLGIAIIASTILLAFDIAAPYNINIIILVLRLIIIISLVFVLGKKIGKELA